MLPAVKGSAAEDTDARKEARLVRVAGYRNRIIRYAMQKEYDAVFLVDSDLILHPALVEYLRATRKGVISELFWSKSCAGRSSGPNAWLMEERAPNSDKRNAALYKKEADRRKKQFADRLKVSGIYEAGGLGSCTYIDKEAMDKGTVLYRQGILHRIRKKFFLYPVGNHGYSAVCRHSVSGLPYSWGEGSGGSFGLYPLQQRKYAALSYGEKKKAGLN